MSILKILSGSIIGTSVMTMFSYYLSGTFKREFKEPVLLNKLISSSRFKRRKSVQKNSPEGWILHYSVGVTFAVFYHFYWEKSGDRPTLQNGAILGFLNGFIGIAGWHLLFKIHHDPPSLQLKDFYIHLLAAHIIYGMGTATGYKIVPSQKEN